MSLEKKIEDEQLGKLKKRELKQILELKNIESSGTKKELIRRIGEIDY